MRWKKWELMSIRLQEQSKSNWEPVMGGFSEDQEEEFSCFFACRKEVFFPAEVWAAQRALFSYQEAVSCRDWISSCSALCKLLPGFSQCLWALLPPSPAAEPDPGFLQP